MGRPEDRWFVSWRTAGDADALARVHDAAAPALLRIALHHVRHPAAAEDLVQATFLAAIQNADAYDPARPLMGWLVGILHNHAKWNARKDARAVDAARLGDRAADDPLAAAQAAEFTVQVDEAIAQLPDAYRPVLRLHLAHELSAAAIAHALDRPAGTVRCQIVRGLELLRAALPAGVALAAFAAIAPARSASALRDAVLAAGRAHTAKLAAVAGTAVAASIMGTKKMLLGAACILACAAGAWVAGSAIASVDVAAPTSPSVPARVAAGGAHVDGVAVRPDGAPPVAREAVADATSVSWRLTGTITDADGERIAAEARVRVAVRCESSDEPFADVSTAHDGSYVVDLDALRALPPIDLERANLDLRIDATGCVPSRVQLVLPHHDPKQVLALIGDAKLALGAVAVGRVLDAGGQPVGGATVTLRSDGDAMVKSPPSARTGLDGCYRVAAPAGGLSKIVASHARHGAAEHPCELVFGRDTNVPDLLLQPRSTLRARVTFADGEPAHGVTVRVRVPGNDRVVASPITDHDGRIVMRTLAAGRYECHASARRGPEPKVLVATDGEETAIVLHGLHLVRFGFADECGRSLRPLSLGYRVWAAEYTDMLSAWAAGTKLPHRIELGSMSGAGTIGSVLVGSGAWVMVRASHRDAHGETLAQALPPRNVHDVRLVLRERRRDATLRVNIGCTDGGAPGAFECDLRQIHPDMPGSPNWSPEGDARDVVAQWFPGRYRLEVRPDRVTGWFVPFEQDVVLTSGGETVCDRKPVIGGRVRLRVHTADPAYRGAIAGFEVAAHGAVDAQPIGWRQTFIRMHADGWEGLAEAPAGEPFLWPPLLPTGRHELVLRSRDHRDATVGVVIEPRTITDVDVYLQAR